jgi:hypothetical protein
LKIVKKRGFELLKNQVLSYYYALIDKTLIIKRVIDLMKCYLNPNVQNKYFKKAIFCFYHKFTHSYRRFSSTGVWQDC